MKKTFLLSVIILLLAGSAWGDDKDCCPKSTISPFLQYQWEIEHECRYEYLMIPYVSGVQVGLEWEYVGPAEMSAEKFYNYTVKERLGMNPKSFSDNYNQNDRFPALLFRKKVCK